MREPSTEWTADMSFPTDKPRLTAKTDVTGRGALVVLVPGGLTGWLSWEPHAKRLAQDRLVIRTQLLCIEFGLSGEPLPPGYSVSMESRALERALDNLEIQEADFVGWSLGGEIALNFALDHPERVRSLTLIEPPAYWVLRGHDQLWADAQAFQDFTETFGPEEVSEAQLERFLFEVGIVSPGTDVRSMPRWPVWVQHRQSLRVGNVEGRHDIDLERVRRFERPVLLFKGEGSPAFMRGAIDLLGEKLPNARVEELPGGHALPLVSMESFLTILGDFLGER